MIHFMSLWRLLLDSVVKTTVGRKTGASGPFGIVRTKESNQWCNIVNFSHTCCGRRRINQRLHVLEELFVGLEPLIGSNGTWIDAVDSDTMALTQFLGPHTDEGLVSSFSGSIHCLASNAKAGTCGRYENDAAALREIGLGSFCEEYGATDITIEMTLVELGCRVDEVGLIALSGTLKELVSICDQYTTCVNALVNQNVNLAVLAELSGSVDQKWNLLKLHHVGLDENSLGADFVVDLINNILCTLRAAFGNIVDNNISAALCKENGDTSTETP